MNNRLEISRVSPLTISGAKGSRLTLANGRELVDGMASEGAAVHGYGDPRILLAIEEQAARLPAAPDGFIDEQTGKLAARLSAILPGNPERIAFFDDGNAAMEAAMQIARRFGSKRSRNKIAGFNGGGIAADFTLDLPRDGEAAAALDRFLESQGEELAGLILQPVIQADAGMIFHNEETLARVRAAADRHGPLLTLDERFTGFGRTGAMFGCEAGGAVADIMVLGGALTGGTLPLAAVAVSHEVCEAIEPGDLQYTGNPLACAAANASLDLFERKNRLLAANEIGKKMARSLGYCVGAPGIKDVRVRGGVGVVELDRIENPNALTQHFVDAGVWIRPFRNVVALTPALTIDDEQLQKLTETAVSLLGGKKP